MTVIRKIFAVILIISGLIILTIGLFLPSI